MDVVLGAWGIGKFLASHSEMWKLLFEHKPAGLTLPPLSSLHPGMVEPFPFLVAKKIYIDSNQYNSIRYASDFRLTDYVDFTIVSEFLGEFEQTGILRPVDFHSLITPLIPQLLNLSESIIDSPDLPKAASHSRRLWLDFLLSPGACQLPYREKEITATISHLNVKSYRGSVPTKSLFNTRLVLPKDEVPIAALRCGHDIFDVVTILKIGELLGAAVCDWQMYDPLYKLAIEVANFEFKPLSQESSQQHNLKWYLPFPKALNIDEIWRLRDDPYLIALRNQPLVKQISELAYASNSESLRRLRVDLQERLRPKFINSYNAHYDDCRQPVVIERLDWSKKADVQKKANNQSDIVFREIANHPRSRHRILFVSSDPVDASRLRISEEYREIKEKIRLSKLRDEIELHEVFSVRAEDFSQALLNVQPTILHFSGHGLKNGDICFEDVKGQISSINKEALSNLFSHFQDKLQLVVLNACHSVEQAEAISSQIDCVIAMTKEIGDKAAIAYSVGLYQAIGAGCSIDTAHGLGCAQIHLRGIEEHDTPILIKSK